METSPYSHKISIVIVTHNSLPALDDSLGGLSEHRVRTDFELVVVDNNSSDGSVACVKRHFPEAKVVELRENIGFGAACNRAAWIAEGEYLLFHNPDLKLDYGAMEALLSVAESRDRFGAGGGRMRFPDGTFQATCRRFPRATNIIFSRGSMVSGILGGKDRYTLGDYAEVTAVPAVAGTMMITRRELFEALNGFDERFCMYMEDTDLCLRLSKFGYDNYFIPYAGGIHLWGQGSRGGALRRNWYHHLSLWKYFLKHFPDAFSLIIMPLVLAVHFALVAMLRKPVRK